MGSLIPVRWLLFEWFGEGAVGGPGATTDERAGAVSRIVLCAAEGFKNTEIAERSAFTRTAAAPWHARFAVKRLDGLVAEPRPGRPRSISDAQVEDVIVRTLETTRKDATLWPTRYVWSATHLEVAEEWCSMQESAGLWETGAPRVA